MVTETEVNPGRMDKFSNELKSLNQNWMGNKQTPKYHSMPTETISAWQGSCLMVFRFPFVLGGANVHKCTSNKPKLQASIHLELVFSFP